jgi:hypothetical protein
VLSGIRAMRAGHVAPSKAETGSVPLTLGLLVRLGHRSIRARERSKSQVILIHTFFKRAYRTLGRQMVDEGLLPDDDLVFFLQHAELGTLLRDRDSALAERALARREVQHIQMKMVFRESYRGNNADPIDPPLPDGHGILHGKPVSRGVARGRARVARTLTETDHFSADVYAYFTADVNLWLWGSLVRAFAKPEGSLFPGLTIGLMAGFAILIQWRSARSDASRASTSRSKSVTALKPRTIVCAPIFVAKSTINPVNETTSMFGI